jgi:multidrug resistance efflux pump
MSAPFSRSLRSMAVDGYRYSIARMLLAAAFLAAWGAWFVLARVSVYAESASARLETDRAVCPIEAPIAGRVVAIHCADGQQVRASDVLYELDSSVERLRLEQERVRLTALKGRREVLEREIAAEAEAQHDDERTAPAGLAEARARLREAEATARLREEEAKRAAALHAKGVLSDLDRLRAEAEAQKQRAAVDALDMRVRQLDLEERARGSKGRVRIEQLRRELADVDGEIATAAAAIDVARQGVERHLIRASVDGRIGEMAPVQTGLVFARGEKLGVIIPDGAPAIVAEFPASEAIGRIRPGQQARLRVDGFPWTQYGSVPAVVTRVAGESRDGRVRVELAVDPSAESRIPIRHGLPGTVEVEVDRVSPAALAAQAVGRTTGVSR